MTATERPSLTDTASLLAFFEEIAAAVAWLDQIGIPTQDVQGTAFSLVERLRMACTTPPAPEHGAATAEAFPLGTPVRIRPEYPDPRRGKSGTVARIPSAPGAKYWIAFPPAGACWQYPFHALVREEA